VKERYHASAQLSNECEHVFAPKKDTSTTIAGSEEDKKQQTLLKKKKRKERKKNFVLFQSCRIFYSFVLTLSRSLLFYSF
tara:strand:- start:7045 stop:7284 length:240 start_codon:yes stop_codon:yes gene_type:complete